MLGEPIYIIANNDTWLLSLEISQSDVDELAPSVSGEFSADARPEERHECTLTRVLPHAEERRGRTVFIAEADLPGNQEWLRPGMEGVARIEIGRRSVFWVLTHDPIEAMRRNFWL